MTDDTAPDAEAAHDAGNAQAAWLGPWSAADKRLLLITLLGGLGANLGIVIIIAGAILAARALTWIFKYSTQNTLGGGIASSLTVLYAFYLFRLLLYTKRYEGSAAGKRAFTVLAVVSITNLAVFVLGGIGYLAGIR